MPCEVEVSKDSGWWGNACVAIMHPHLVLKVYFGVGNKQVLL